MMPDQFVCCVCCNLLVLFNACFNRAVHNAELQLPETNSYNKITEVYVVIVFAKQIYLSLDGYYLSCLYIQI